MPEVLLVAGRDGHDDEQAETLMKILDVVARADLILAVSPADRLGFIERYGADPARVVVVPNGADTQAYRPTDPDARRAAKRELGLPERPMVLFAGCNAPPNRDGVGWVRRLASRTERFVRRAVRRLVARNSRFFRGEPAGGQPLRVRCGRTGTG